MKRRWFAVAGGFFLVVAALGGLTLAFIGADWFRGGRHFDLSAYELGPIFGDAPLWAGREASYSAASDGTRSFRTAARSQRTIIDGKSSTEQA